MQCWIAQIYRP
ncbi:hypothetical protein MTR67_001942 [Solanum verrucosum]|uniref:Uncharacterized protein n=1 Tax=Solanum verrucosum TaxID=315347 RepID=A0AAF0T5G5_SOLVR|nr:hypothetical protein MTR67_001942 [Solanum verrucosum]